ncbi:MAG: hypothetical protein PSX81_02990 [bacterium]|nr:hypothetical protein [bacterium]
MNRILAGLTLTLLLLNVHSVSAQVNKIKSVRNIMNSGQDVNITTAKYNIDLAYENAQTSNSVDMWCWRAIVYSYIGYNTDTSISNMDIDAARKSGQSFKKYYEFSEQERSSTQDEANSYILMSGILCFNKALNLSNENDKFNEVKEYMGYVENIMKNDEKGQLAAQNLTLAKVYLILLQSAQKNNLVDEEIYYLNQLVATPKYFNAYIYIRLSEIYSEKKEYDKALDILAKGKEKIPASTSDFLNAEITIEIERDHITALIAKFNEGIAQDPENAIYYYNRGTTYSMLKNKDVENEVTPSKYYFSQGLNDFKKAIELDPSNQDASFNEASLLVDSANFVYRLKSKFPEKYDFYEKLSISIYKQALEKLELIRQTGLRKDAELIDMLKTMRSICSKIGDEDGRKKYNEMYKEEENKLRNSSN